jgi:hypothetical protein
MTYQTTEPLPSYRLNASNRSASEVAGESMWPQLDLNPPYQRGSVWNHDQRMALVRSWIMGVAIPAVILNNRDNPEWAAAEGSIYGNGHRDDFLPTWAVVDGKQRIETARLWFESLLAVPASWFVADRVEHTHATSDGPYVTFHELTRPGQLFTMRDWQLAICEPKLPNLTAEAELYLLVNGGGTPQTEADMANAARVAARKR